MSISVNEPLRILRFWRDLEIFNIPTAPSAKDSSDQTKITTLRHGDILPWCRSAFQPTETYGYVHVVYVGVGDNEDLSRLLLQSLFPKRDLSEGERQSAVGNGWLGAFVVNELGRIKSDSYLPASFVHGVAAFRETRSLDNLNARLERAKEEFAQRHLGLSLTPEETNSTAHEPGTRIVDWRELDEELRIVCGLLGAEKEINMDWRVVVRTSRIRRRVLEEGLQAATDFLNSFYLDDLDRLIILAEKSRPFGGALSSYLGPALDDKARIDTLTNHGAMAQLVSARNLPSARWPSPAAHPLALAQQAAVSQVISSLGDTEGLIGINGPPGTGKTTLLCDVIAEIVTERARRIASLDRPGALFEPKIDVAGKSFFPIRQEVIAGTSIVVTSSNNNAVKNITQELPARKKVGAEFSHADYFGDVMGEIFRAQKVLDEKNDPIDTWGMIAAALGNAGNRRSFAQGFFRDEYVPANSNSKEDSETSETDLPADEIANSPTEEFRPQSMKQILEKASGQYRQHAKDWYNAKETFLQLQAEFDGLRQVLEQAEQAATSIDVVQERLNELAAEANAIEQEIQTGECSLSKLEEAQARNNRATGALRRLKRWFKSDSGRMATAQIPTQEAESPAELSATITTLFTRLEDRRQRLKAVLAERTALEKELEGLRLVLDAGYKIGTKHFPNAEFWALPAQMRHRSSIAVSPVLDDLRSRLFLQAAELHRLSVLANAGKFIANLRAVHGMLTGSSRDKLSVEHRPLLWDALFFIVPIVSTTLASFDRLFIGMGQNSLGWLLIDEAGQATPQSAAGAIWRSRRAVIVGDPLQIEPVFTVPRFLAEELRHRHAVDSHWSPIDESVQTLADRITPFGSWVEVDNNTSPAEPPERIWTGMPLRTHRRCEDPMFSIANRIAYADQMVQGSVDSSGQPLKSKFACCLGESAWFDVQSTRVTHPVSEDEIACLIHCLQQLNEGTGAGAGSKIYVISPFRKIAQACQRSVRQAGILGVECGTVHTFQGKEASIVFLVLGTAPGQTGAGARGWAASKPNLLNVAVTRAKSRLFVIGDASQWGKMNYFRELHGALPKRRLDMTSSSSGT